MKGYIDMKKIIIIAGFIVTFIISLMYTYTTQTPYYTLSKNIAKPATTSTPVIDPVYALNNQGWSGKYLSVNISNLPNNVKKDLVKNIHLLKYPIHISSSKNAVSFVYTQTPHQEHALTTNTGNTILIDDAFLHKYSKNPSQIAKTLSHELGHSLGLLHTSTESIMYPSKNDLQTLSLNNSQKAYLRYLSKTNIMTKYAAKLINMHWNASTVNNFTLSQTMPYTNLSIFSSPKLLKQSNISAIIILMNVLPIMLIYLAIVLTLTFINRRRR